MCHSGFAFGESSMDTSCAIGIVASPLGGSFSLLRCELTYCHKAFAR